MLFAIFGGSAGIRFTFLLRYHGRIDSTKALPPYGVAAVEPSLGRLHISKMESFDLVSNTS